jgi:hypothetical protein
MSSVVEFVLRKRAEKEDAGIESSAEIIIFPGVRIERIEFDADVFEPQDPQAPQSGRGLKNQRAAKS